MSGLHKYPIVHEIHYNRYCMAMSNIYAEIMNSGFMNEAHCHGVKSIPQE
ncbi:hypothetical protein Plhal304r1_c031g0101431 [Plasmopara halstedii]